MGLKLFVDIEDDKGAVKAALHQVFGMIGAVSAKDGKEAHVIICEKPEKCLVYLQDGKYVAQLVSPSKKGAHNLKNSPEFEGRFEVFSIITIVAGFLKFVHRILKENPKLLGLDTVIEDSETENEPQIKPTSTLHVLLVDDKPIHLGSGRRQLSKTYQLMLCRSYGEAIETLETGTIDILLCDLLMPAESHTLGPKGMEHFGREIAVGLFLPMIAAEHGVKYVIVLTDQNHHDHPMSAAVDWISPYTIDQTHVVITHARLDENGAKDWARPLNKLLDKAPATSD